jgi:DNA-binding LacI/PurR family transcriptional regulator
MIQATFDQSEFEIILAEWLVACDQPFDQVGHPAFRKLLNYVHAPARKPLSIPGRTTIRKRIMKLGQDSIESTKNMFKVSYFGHSQQLLCY